MATPDTWKGTGEREPATLVERLRRDANRAAVNSGAPEAARDALACFALSYGGASNETLWRASEARHGGAVFAAAYWLVCDAIQAALTHDAIFDLSHLPIGDTGRRNTWRAGFTFGRDLKALGLA